MSAAEQPSLNATTVDRSMPLAARCKLDQSSRAVMYGAPPVRHFEAWLRARDKRALGGPEGTE